VIETAARGAQFLLAIGIAYLIALWFALVAWTFRDIEARSRSVFTQVFSTLLVVLFFVPGLLLYLILRPKETLDQAFQRALEEEYLLQDLDDLPLCPGCQRAVDADFVICPHCQTRLRGPCPACSRLIDLRWSVCPYCAVATDRSELESAESGIESVHVLDESRAGRRKRAISAAAQRVGIENDELDALTDALSHPGNHAAVGAGHGGTGLSRRIAAMGELSRVRDAAKGRFGLPTFGSDDHATSSLAESDGEVTTGEQPSAEESFWAAPLPAPGSERNRGRPPESSS
jgi:hypothetical protein